MVAAEFRSSNDEPSAPPALGPKRNSSFNKCGAAPLSIARTEVSFGSWARGVMAAQDPVKVRARVRIPPGPFLLRKDCLSGTSGGFAGRGATLLKVT
jgi:hypothetical protein